MSQPTGQLFQEPLLWERGAPGRSAFSMPRSDVPAQPLDEALIGDVPDLPDLSEPEIVRHYTRLSQWNLSVDSSMYPLGSCTMKYNPKPTNARPGCPASPPPIPSCPQSCARDCSV
jgi:glycine dehydrogenase subunit 2